MSHALSASSIRERLEHPVIDADGHVIEYLPTIRDFIREEAGASVADRLDDFTRGRAASRVPREQRRSSRAVRGGWWGFPAENTLDRATAMLPELFVDRLDELGIDFAVAYPSFGLHVSGIRDDEFRQALARACNRYYSEVAFGRRDRLEPVATIPMRTPDEALRELEYAIVERGMKAVVMAGVILRPLPGAEGTPGALYVDTVGHDAEYDYDPVWARCVELGVTPTFHTLGLGWGSRTSSRNFVFNHVGHFAAAQEATCRGLVIGGVPSRFPELRFSFLEGGVAWAANLLSDLAGHFDKRNRAAIESYNPARLDRNLLSDLVARHGHRDVKRHLGDLEYALSNLVDDAVTEEDLDEFRDSGIASEETLLEWFTERFFFGCEADDPLVPIAFDQRLPPRGACLRPMFASDIGHFDVPDALGVLPEAWELVEHGLIGVDEFRAFTFSNAARLWATQKPSFFDGTACAAEVRTLAVRAHAPEMSARP